VLSKAEEIDPWISPRTALQVVIKLLNHWIVNSQEPFDNSFIFKVILEEVCHVHVGKIRRQSLLQGVGSVDFESVENLTALINFYFLLLNALRVVKGRHFLISLSCK
jgi:hypothetical protein